MQAPLRPTCRGAYKDECGRYGEITMRRNIYGNNEYISDCAHCFQAKTTLLQSLCDSFKAGDVTSLTLFGKCNSCARNWAATLSPIELMRG